MTDAKLIWGAAAAMASIALLVGCHSDHDNSGATTPPPPTSSTTNFSAFAEQVFAAGADTTPVNFDSLTLVYDVNDDPTAFNALLM